MSRQTDKVAAAVGIAVARAAARKVPECLAYAGALGHKFAVTLERDGVTRVRLETDSYASAEAEREQCHNPATPARVWIRLARGWVPANQTNYAKLRKELKG